MKNIFCALNFIIISAISNAQMVVPAPKQDSASVIMNGRAHIGNGQIIENSAIGIENGKITFVSDARTIRLDMSKFKVIGAYGKDVYPGLIAPNTDLGLIEIEAARATNDKNEVGDFNPCIRSITSYNTDSKVIPTVRSNGILLAQIVPGGGIISGTSSVVQLDAWNWEDAAYKMDEGIHLNWPGYYRFDVGENGNGFIKVNENYSTQVDVIKDYFLQAKSFHDLSTIKTSNIQFEAMQELFTKAKTIYIHADGAKEITSAVLFAKELNLKCVIVGGTDSWKCIDVLKENNVAVILHRNQSLPSNNDEDVDQPYKTPVILQQAGILFCNSVESFWQNRNLPFDASQSVPYGLSKEDALSSVTKNTAEILGIADKTGTLEPGKDANIVISTGDIMDMKTNHVEFAFIQGRMINLDNKQKDLYEIYRKKYELK